MSHTKISKLLAAVTSVALTGSMLPMYLPANVIAAEDGQTEAYVLYGDANGDGQISAEDASLVENNILNGDESAPIDKTSADVNTDGIIDFKDAELILQYYVEATVVGGDKTKLTFPYTGEIEWRYYPDPDNYKVFNEGMTWTEAEAYCEGLGGHLVTITSAQEQ
ncbi:MAG: hypothetical protein J6U00_15065, partial [Ruminococcus sp.]|uniref:dockerin type I domain-containing protein n=1 Tax=Ruminococcus sp. TaxID=41978 RepID=UPI001B22015E